MFRPKWKCLWIGVVLLGLTGATASQADACGLWWRCWGCYRPAYSYCYSTYYTPAYTVSCDPCCSTGSWYLGVRPGPIRRFLFGPYRWYYSPWGYLAGCCWDVACCGTGEASEAAAESSKTPTLAPPKASKEEKPPAKETTGPSALHTRPDAGVLSIRVPADAKVIINGLATTSTGTERQYVSYGLKPGLTYKYDIRAQVVRNGQAVEDVRTVYLTASARQQIAFDFRSQPEQAVATVW